MKRNIENKIKNGVYRFEYVDCLLCKNRDFRLLAEKDRYGLNVSTVICKSCGLVQSNPRMDERSNFLFYDNEYRKLYVGDGIPTEKFFIKQLNHGKEILKYIELKTELNFRDKFVVEIGTGAGGILKVFKNKGNKVLGLDLGSEYINYGKKQGLNLVQGTIKVLEKLKIKPDLVIYSHVLEHLSNPIEELTELKKYLKKDSYLYIEVPGIMNLQHSYNQNFLRYLQNAHLYHFTLRSLLNIMHKSGYRLITGNEKIKSIFMPGKSDSEISNEFESIYQFLIDLEKRKRLFNLERMKKKLKSKIKIIIEMTIKMKNFRKIEVFIFNEQKNIKKHLSKTTKFKSTE